MKCKSCGCIDQDNFYESNKSMCKDCTKKRVRARRVEKIDEIREYDRNRPNHKERVKKNSERRKYLKQKDPEKYEKYLASQRDWGKKNKHKRNAHLKLARAVMNGTVIKKNVCEMCGGTSMIEAHHADYSKPLDVVWLCKKCHSEEHKKIKIRSERILRLFSRCMPRSPRLQN